MQKYVMNDLSELPTTVADILALALEKKLNDVPVVLALHGDLGAGKTTFTQTLAKQLGVSETVVSPTFVVMKEYATEHEQLEQLIHIDAYRIEAIDELRPLRFTELLQVPASIICIEWAENIAALLPVDTLHLNFTSSGNTREITINHD